MLTRAHKIILLAPYYIFTRAAEAGPQGVCVWGGGEGEIFPYTTQGMVNSHHDWSH